MNYKLVSRIIALVLLIEGAFMLVPAAISAFNGNTNAALSFLAVIGLICLIAIPAMLLTKSQDKRFYVQEGFVTTAFTWIFMPFLGCLPFWISGEIPSFIDAWFETVSGFTTTGASVLTDVEALSKGMIYWRSFGHWLGGMGVLVFLLAVIPAVAKGSGSDIHLMRAESPGPEVGKLTPHIRKTAIILYAIYVAMTLLCFIFLVVGDMPFFDSVCMAFGVAGTGGFAILNDGIMSYSTYSQIVMIVFMLLFGINFFVYYMLLNKDFKNVLKSQELKLYFAIYFVAAFILFIDIRSLVPSLGEALKHSFFQPASLMTTSGFNTVEFDSLSSLSRVVLTFLMFTGGCAGSTAGGFKLSRVLILVKSMRRNVRKAISPNRIESVTIDEKNVSEQTVNNVSAYFVVYCMIILASVFVISLDNYSAGANLSSVISCVNNIGPVFDMTPANSFSSFSVLSKIVLIFDMIIGRLELFPMVVLLSKLTWRRNR